MNFVERALVFPCADDQLLGVLALPEKPSTIGVLIVVGGPQYRVGSHRQFVLLAREMAAAAFPVMRFDFRGMGDSSGAKRGFEEVGEDIGAAINAFLLHCPEIKRVVLWGLCDGASAALLYQHAANDPRVAGMVLLNPWVRSDSSLAATRMKHYYGQRLLQKAFWHKLVHGRLDLRDALYGFFRNLGQAARKPPRKEARLSYQTRMAQALSGFSGKVLLILSEEDYTAKEFLEYCATDASWRDALSRAALSRWDLPGADHTFSTARHRGQVAKATVQFLREVQS
jgi:exosortase A-associated hydrolase 1